MQEHLLLQLTGQGAPSLPLAGLSQVSGLDMAVLGQRWCCRLQWTGEGAGSPSYSTRHIDIWALKQFCWLSLPSVFLGTLNQSVRLGSVPIHQVASSTLPEVSASPSGITARTTLHSQPQQQNAPARQPIRLEPWGVNSETGRLHPSWLSRGALIHSVKNY